MAEQDDTDRKQDPKGKRGTGRRAIGTSQITETDFAADEMGRNALQGDDQDLVRNQRHAVPDVKREADEDPIETMEKTDKDERARRDLGKRRGSR